MNDTETTRFLSWFNQQARLQKIRQRTVEVGIGALTALLVGGIVFAVFQNFTSLLAGGASGLMASALLALTFHEKLLNKVKRA